MARCLFGFSGGPPAERARQAFARQKDAAYAAALTEIYPTYPNNSVSARGSWIGRAKCGRVPAIRSRRRVKSRPSDHCCMRASDRLHFAGEHACYKFVGYMEGALNSGVVGGEANRGARWLAQPAPREAAVSSRRSAQRNPGRASTDEAKRVASAAVSRDDGADDERQNTLSVAALAIVIVSAPAADRYVASPYLTLWRFSNALNSQRRQRGLKHSSISIRSACHLSDSSASSLPRRAESRQEDRTCLRACVERFAPALIDQLVDAFVTPEGLAVVDCRPSAGAAK